MNADANDLLNDQMGEENSFAMSFLCLFLFHAGLLEGENGGGGEGGCLSELLFFFLSKKFV